ncbi:NAD-dependent epimerase/dehydratase family protein [Labilibacter sediminis]|nr:NAD-dependent epimerase/dehydratase family protein [Labilibacter sediminis]
MINYTNKVVQDDMNLLYDSFKQWSKLKGQTVLITGATGMLASYTSFILMYLNESYAMDINILLLVRNKVKAKEMFGSEGNGVRFLVQDVVDEINYEGKIDYIIHAAGGASPYQIINNPVGIINANIQGTINVLNFARTKEVKNILFTSTREVYGKIENVSSISEDDFGSFNPLDDRSCYPESKRMAETIFSSYRKQYNTPYTIARIAHSYGPGMQIENDGRVMSDFIYDVLNRPEIVINSSGLAERAFCYITDAVVAMYAVLLNGKVGEAYNIANEEESVSLVDLAKMLCRLSKGNKQVVTKDQDQTGVGYCNYKRVMLSTSKLRNLGWKPIVNLEEGLVKTLASFFNCNL